MSAASENQDSARIDVRDFIDNSKMSGYQKLLLALCFIVVFFDGFDVQAVAVAAPSLKETMGLTPSQLGTIFAAGSLGAIVSAFGIASFADRIGRRPLIIGSMITSGLLSLGYVLADSFMHLLILRIVAGFCLAAGVTIAYTYCAEIAPKRAAATAVMIASAGYGLGVAATGFMSGWMIPRFGWESIFYFGGFSTLALGIALLFLLPESVRLLALREGQGPKIEKILRRVNPAATFPAAPVFYLNEESKPGLVFSNLLKEGRALPAISLWASAFCINFVVYIFMQWLPSMVSAAGGDASQQGFAVAWYKVGGILGSFALAYYIDRRRNGYPVLTLFLLATCVTLVMMSNISATSTIFIWVVFASGVLLCGPQYAWNGLVARLFPTYVRAGAMTTYAGFSRSGSMLGPYVVGFLMQAGWTNKDVFQGALVPAFIAVGITAGLGLREMRLIAREKKAALAV